MNCKNCFGEIENLRKETQCSICNSPIHKDCAIKDGGAFFCDVCYTVKEEKQEANIEIPSVIRRSYIETYRKCPYKFYMQVLKGYEMPPTIYTQLGIDLHKIFDDVCKNRSTSKKQTLEYFKEIFSAYTSELFGDVDRSKMYQRGIDSIDTFYKVLEELPETPFSGEETIEFPIGEELPLVQATSDRVDLVNGKLEISDWKTGVVMVGQMLSTDLQAPLYINSVIHKYNMPVRKFTFYYLHENKTRTFEHEEGENYACVVGKRIYRINLTDAIREVQHVFSQIKKGVFNIPRDTKKMYFTCKMCHLRQQEICKGADIESWNQINRR